MNTFHYESEKSWGVLENLAMEVKWAATHICMENKWQLKFIWESFRSLSGIR